MNLEKKTTAFWIVRFKKDRINGKKLADLKKRALEKKTEFEELMKKEYELRWAQIQDVEEALSSL